SSQQRCGPAIRSITGLHSSSQRLRQTGHREAGIPPRRSEMKLFTKFLACAALAGLASASTADAADFSARLGSLDPTTTAKHRGLVKAAELIKQRTGGKVEITIFPSSQLGNAREMTEAVQLGSLDA